MSEKKEKPISVRLSPKALARLNRLTTELDMNRTSVIQEALKALEREQEAQKQRAAAKEASATQNGNGASVEGEPLEKLQSGA
jgi:predicted transcriptional regulator